MLIHSRLSVLVAVIGFAVFACEPHPQGESRLGFMFQGIYYGTREPQNVTLTDGQKLAIGWFFTPGEVGSAWCSGTIIAPRVVASADHCLQGIHNLGQIGFGVGLLPSSPAATFAIDAVHRHPSLDAALFILAEDATHRVPSLTPIAFNRQNPTQWLSQKLDAAGYGQTHDGSTGRFFASVWLDSVRSDTVVVDGRGQQGICFGDSGGPLLAPGPVVVAVESYGDMNCVGRDYMIRLDALAAWIDPILGSDECGDLDYLGRCNGHVAEWCDGGQVSSRDCSLDGLTCGFVDNDIGYYCVAAPVDECGGLDYLGRCNGDVAEWCQEGQIRQYDCAVDGMTCGYVDGETGYNCVERQVEDPCEQIGPLGRCDGQVAEWCEGGVARTRDCASENRVCGFVDNQIGYSCIDDPGGDDCAVLGAGGRCNGDVLVRCVDGEVSRTDCAALGQNCVPGEGGALAACVEADDDHRHVEVVGQACDGTRSPVGALPLCLLMLWVLIVRGRHGTSGRHS